MNRKNESWLTAGLGLFLSMIVVVPFAVFVLMYAKQIIITIVFLATIAIVIYTLAIIFNKDKVE